jgi:glucokinase
VIVLAGDFGGSRLKLGVLRGRELVARRVEPAQADLPLERRLAGVAATWRELCAEAGVAAGEVAGLGVAFPSIVDAARGRILDEWGKYPGCAGFDFPEWGRREFGRPLVLENDARAALVGEWRQGAGLGCGNLALFTLGTGLGTAVVMEGRLLAGAHGQAGILGGHFTVRHGGRPCVCGNRGCAEAEASTAVLAELARRPEFRGGALAALERPDYAAVFGLAAAGDAGAAALRDHSLEVWSAAAVNLVHAYDPELLIVGGGIADGAPEVVAALRAEVGRRAHTAWGRVEVAPARLGADAALYGCGWLVAAALAP